MTHRQNHVRFTLRSILWVTVVFALGLAWFVDHVRLQSRLGDLSARSDVQRDEIEQLRLRLDTLQRERDRRLTLYWWSNADEFIDALKKTEHGGDFAEMAVSLSRCEDSVLRESLLRLIDLTDAQDARIRNRAVQAIAIVHQQHPERMVDFEPRVVSALIPMIDDENQPASVAAIRLLGKLGPSATGAMDALRARMVDNTHYSSPYAAHALATIDPNVDVGPWLIECIQERMPKRSWIAAAQVLGDHVGKAEAREILTEAYQQAENERERKSLLNVLNRIKPSVDESESAGVVD